MEVAMGGDLYTNLRAHQVSFNGARFYAAEILCALEYLHSNEICYRDLKPENISLSSTGHAKISDFGLSRIIDQEDGHATTCCGTKAYTPPEMLLGRKYGFSVDYWQYACLLYELFVGHSPFYDPSVPSSETWTRIRKGKFSFPEETYSRRWRQAVSALLVVDVRQRLGCRRGDDGWRSVASQRFFENIDWKGVRAQEYLPPLTPLRPGESYTKNFD
ncbi:unnamed protein product, partial [Heterosigma akashiwo]